MVSSGDRIVNVGMRSLSDGDKVIVWREGVCCTNGSVVFDRSSSKSDPTTPSPAKAGATENEGRQAGD